MLLVLIIIFVVVMLLWALMLAGTVTGNDKWLAFISVLILGIVVFLLGAGVIVVDRPAITR